MKRPTIFIFVLILSLSVSLSMTEAQGGDSLDSLRGPSLSIAQLRLKGTLFTRSLKPIAIIENTENGRITMYELGDTVEGGFKIIEIARGEVSLNAQGVEYKLSFPEGAIWQPQSLDNEDEKWYNIGKEGDTFIIDKATISGAIYRVRDIMKNVKIKPCYMDGEESGIIIAKLNEIGILKEVGVKESDIIKSINGLELNSPYQIFNAYRKLKDKQELKVSVIRENKPLTLSYKIKK